MPALGDVLTAARRKLLADADFDALLNVDVGKDPMGQLWDDGWVFRAYGPNHAPYRDPANTGFAAITMHLRDPWTSPNLHNTLSFRLLTFEILADRSRDRDDPSLSSAYDAEDRCDRVATAIKNVFNDVANADHSWPNDVYVVSCVLYNDLELVNVPNQDGLIEGTLRFALSLG